jgi:predicted RND superfamily exporter protein
MKNPETLRALDALEQHLARNPLVGKTTSLASMVRRVSLVLHDNDPAYNRVPADEEQVIGADGQRHTVPGKELISQYVLLYENGGGGLLRDVLDFKAEKAKVRIDLRTNSSNEVRAVMNDVSNFVAQSFPSDLKTRFGGTGYVLIWAGNEIIFGQVSNLLGSLVVVLLILLVAFRSLVKAILALLPVLTAGLFNFGLLGALGVKLDIGSALVSSVAIGVGVDYAIHYVTRLGQELAVTADADAALEASMRRSGPAIVANVLTVGAGFMVLLASEFIPINTIGWMVCLTQFTSGAATLILLPAILRVVRPAFLGLRRPISAAATLVGQP